MPVAVQSRTVAARSADWTDSVTLDQIDPASGIQSIALELTATLSSLVSIYSLERSASTFSSGDSAVVRLQRPDGTALLTAGPTTYVSTVLPAATGLAVPDFLLRASASESEGVSYGPGSGSGDAALLIGTGTVTLPLVATARVVASAPGNFGAVFDSQVGATVTTTATTGQAGTGASGTTGSVFQSGGFQSGGYAFNTYVITTPVQHVQIAQSTTGWSQALGVAGFDASLGTLQRVNVVITAGTTGSLQAENLDSVAAYLGVSQTATVDLDANGAVLDSQAATITSNRTLAAFDGTIDQAGASGESLFGQTASGTGTVALSDAASLAAFTGANAAGISVAGIGQTAIDGPGALSIDGALKAGAGIDVSYTYTPAVGALFDASYYLAHNPDVAASGVDPYQHYVTYGWHEGRDPSALFDTNYYLQQNPDVAAAGVDPLLHFATFGWHEGRDPSLLFSDSKYAAANPGVTGDPLLSYQQGASGTYGLVESSALMTFLAGGALPADPLVDTAFYDKQLGATLIPTGAAGAQQAAWSYDASGWEKGLNPDALFDTTYYLSHNPDVAAAHVDPLLHYETFGWKEGRDPSASFSTDKYLAAYSDVKAAGMDPLLHYVAFGAAEHRTAFSA